MPDKKRKNKKSRTVNVAPLYNEDIGVEGLKRKGVSRTNEISFQLPVDDQEESKRQKRMVSDAWADDIYVYGSEYNRNSLLFMLCNGISIQERFVNHNKKQSISKKSNHGKRKISGYAKSKAVDLLDKNKKLVGKSTELEKSYMRLTTAPKATDVRPLSVLRRSLAHVKAHYIQNEDFTFTNEQLKSKFHKKNATLED